MKVIVIVDAYSTGKYLPYAFKSHGYKLVHIQSQEKTPDVFVRTHADIIGNFLENIIFTNTDDVVKALKKYDVKLVIPGAESGVLVADKVSEALQLPTSNGTELSLARRDKRLMHQTLAGKGVAYIPHKQSAEEKTILEWAETKESGFIEGKCPLVLKPVESAGTDNVHFCYSKEDIKKYFNQIIQANNIFGNKNTAVLAQKYIDGKEYLVNTVSYAGIHFVTEIWRIHKKTINNIPICDYEELVPHTEEVFSVMSDYVEKVLNALGIKYGAGHSEIMLTAEGPVLIESAARMIGGIDPSAYTEALGYSPVSMLVDAYLNPQNFLRFANAPRLPIQKLVRNVFLISEEEGMAKIAFDDSRFSALPGFHSASCSLRVGDTVERTNSYFNSHGFIYFVSSSNEEIQTSYDLTRKAEKEMFVLMVKGLAPSNGEEKHIDYAKFLVAKSAMVDVLVAPQQSAEHVFALLPANGGPK